MSATASTSSPRGSSPSRSTGCGDPGSSDRGPGFGEIALLHAVPRTATVTADTEGRLLTVLAEDFLAAVTGSPDGHAVAREVSRAYLERDRD